MASRSLDESECKEHWGAVLVRRVMSTFGPPQLSPPSSLPTLSSETKGNHAQAGHLTPSKAQAVVTEPDEAAHAKRVFHYQRESSEVELFYDLFFVGTIATVSIHNEIVNAQSE